MTQQLYDNLWHYSEQFTRESLQRSELITIAWKEGERLGKRCTPGLMKSHMHFRRKELNKRSAFPLDEVGKKKSDVFNHPTKYRLTHQWTLIFKYSRSSYCQLRSLRWTLRSQIISWSPYLLRNKYSSMIWLPVSTWKKYPNAILLTNPAFTPSDNPFNKKPSPTCDGKRRAPISRFSLSCQAKRTRIWDPKSLSEVVIPSTLDRRRYYDIAADWTRILVSIAFLYIFLDFLFQGLLHFHCGRVFLHFFIGFWKRWLMRFCIVEVIS